MKPDKYQSSIIDSPLRGNKMIIASPGSGKTHVMVLAYLKAVDSGVNAESIAVMTFSTSAANEIRERIEKKVKLAPSARKKICTIHAFCNRALKHIWDGKGLPHRKMWNRADHMGKVENPEYFLDKITQEVMDKHRLHDGFRATISDSTRYISERYSALEYDHDRYVHLFGPDTAMAMHEIFSEYSVFMKENRLIDFRTMLAHVEQWMIRSPAIRSSLQSQNEIVISDESQDLFPQASRIITTISQEPGWNRIYDGVTPAR